MATETPTTAPDTELVAAEPLQDRSLVAPVVDEMASARESLTELAIWMHGCWPAGLYPPAPHNYRVGCHYSRVDELLAARHALDALGSYLDVGVEVLVDEHDEDDRDLYGRAIVHLAGRVEVQVQATRDLWLQAFPDDAAPCEHDYRPIEANVLGLAPGESAEVCLHCSAERTVAKDGSVVDVVEGQL